MASTTPGSIRKFHEKVANDRKLNIDFCLGLERKDAKYITALINDIDRCSDTFDRVYMDQDPPRQNWPPDLDYGTYRQRFFADFSVAPGDADIYYWLDRSAGTVNAPICNSLHSQILDVFRSLFVATHDPNYFHLIFSGDEPDEFVNAVSEAAHEALAEIGREHRGKLEKMTPALLRAEAEAACRLLEEKQHDDDRGSGGEQSVHSLPARAIELLLGEEGREILEIVRSSRSVDEKMRDICGIDMRHLALSSPQWAEFLGVSGGAIRKAQFWKDDRSVAIKADMEMKKYKDD